MPIGLVGDDSFEAELKRLRGVRESHPATTRVDIVDILPPSHGRNAGDVNVPDSLRKIIGEEAVISGRQAALSLAKGFGISASSVSAYSKGATSTASYHQPSSSILSHINKSRVRAIKKATSTLGAALGSISQEKLDYADAKDLSGIAKDMSVIIKNLEPQSVDTSLEAKAPQFVIYAPQFKDERSFEVINVNE